MVCGFENPGGSEYLQVGVLHELELLLDDMELFLLRLDVSLQYASPLLQLLFQLMHHPQLGWEMVHWLQGTENKILGWNQSRYSCSQ